MCEMYACNHWVSCIQNLESSNYFVVFVNCTIHYWWDCIQLPIKFSQKYFYILVWGSNLCSLLVHQHSIVYIACTRKCPTRCATNIPFLIMIAAMRKSSVTHTKLSYIRLSWNVQRYRIQKITFCIFYAVRMSI